MWQSPNDFVLNNVFWNPKGFVSWTPPLGGWVKYNVEGSVIDRGLEHAWDLGERAIWIETHSLSVIFHFQFF